MDVSSIHCWRLCNQSSGEIPVSLSPIAPGGQWQHKRHWIISTSSVIVILIVCPGMTKERRRRGGDCTPFCVETLEDPKEWWVISQRSSCRSWTTELNFVAPLSPHWWKSVCSDLCTHVLLCNRLCLLLLPLYISLFRVCVALNKLSKNQKINRGSSVSCSVKYPKESW